MSTRIPVYFDGSIPMEVIANALRNAGIHLRIEAGCRFVAEPIPPFVRKDADNNVVPMRKVKP